MSRPWTVHQRSSGVLAAVDGTPASLGVARQAAVEAALRGSSLTLVHVPPPDQWRAPVVPLLRRAERRQQLATDEPLLPLMRVLRREHRTLVIGARRCDGPPPGAVTTMTRRAQLLVCGDVELGRAVAPGSGCPVLTVPATVAGDGWEGRRRRLVVAAVCCDGMALTTLRAAAAEADRTSSRLLLLLTGAVPAPRGDAQGAADRFCRSLFAELRHRRPGATFVHDPRAAAVALRQLVAGAGLVVVGGSPRRKDSARRTEEMQEAALGSGCPVLSVPVTAVEAPSAVRFLRPAQDR